MQYWVYCTALLCLVSAVYFKYDKEFCNDAFLHILYNLTNGFPACLMKAV